jgi:MerR family redox-sensitive transcriptional activator SoxR
MSIKEIHPGTLTIGEVATRTGLATSAVRFYEDKGLVSPQRSTNGHRAFHRSAIRRLSFILVAQQLGYRLDEIRRQLDTLPTNEAPTAHDWQRLNAQFAVDLDDRIQRLGDLRERLAGCIGCGCLSLDVCHLYNAEDQAAAFGTGPRYLLGDQPPQPT